MSVSKSAFANVQLIQGCAANDRRSQELLYRQYYKPLLALCFRYTRNQEDAIEVLHDGFLKIFKNIREYDASKSSLFTWVTTIMVRSSIDFLRKRKFETVNIEWSEATEPSVDADILRYKSAEEIYFFLKQLPPATCTVFNLYAVEGYSHKEIAALLNISEGTSKWHLSEAKKQLARQVKERAIA